jgi:hypothetical protein
VSSQHDTVLETILVEYSHALDFDPLTAEMTQGKKDYKKDTEKAKSFVKICERKKWLP